MRVTVFYDETARDADIIELPETIANDLPAIQERFFRWLFDKNNDHGYWVFENGEKKLCAYDAEAFVFWVNKECLCRGCKKASVVEKYAQKIDPAAPCLFF